MVQINIERTNNPNIIKFVLNKMLTDGAFEFSSLEEAKDSPLAQQLFKLPFIKKVFISANFIALERYDMLEWGDVEEDLKEILTAYFEQNKPLFQSESKKAIEIYAEETPNPTVQKFVTNQFLTKHLIEVKNQDDATEVPLAAALFQFPFVKEVFINQNYISVTRDNSVEWFMVNNEMRQFIKDYLSKDNLIVTEAFVPSENQRSENSLDMNAFDETSQKIISILDEYIRPAVAGDGGNILFKSYDPENKMVNVILQGACNGCPSSTITLKNGIEATLKQFLPNEIEGVNALN
ncbi:NifU family protein [Namhaeicola litoreus]|uniref:NifU family protein n=1 Tax=Namhaeicola litoreus TaxID=1052145 RepID=A0ABW3Y042_9FLAO